MQIQDDELDKLEEEVRKLKNKYDQFFAGIIKMPPMFDRKHVEVMLYEVGKQKMRESTRRFRYQTILSKYNQFRELWGRKMREREEGPLDFRRRQAAMQAAPAAPPPPPAAATQQQRVTSAAADPYVTMAPGSNGDELRRLYEEIRSEHQKLGKQPNVSLEQLSAMVQKQSEMVRERYKVSSVAFRVETVDGKVKLKAKPVQDR